MYTKTKLQDHELVQRSVQGDEQAFAELLGRYQSYVYALAMNYVSNKEDAEDIMQETFIKVISGLKSFRQDSKFSTWLYSLVYYTSVDWLRKRKRITKQDIRHHENLPSEDSFFATPDKNSDITYLPQALKMVTEEDATILTLFYYMDQSLDEISVIMKIANRNTMKVKLFRARKNLKRAMDKILKGNTNQLL